MKLSPQHSFATFFFLQNLPRGMLLTVIPLQAYALMGNAQDASVLLFAVSIGGILAALTLPILIRRIGLYPAFLLSSAAMVVSALLIMTQQVWAFSVGLFCQPFAIAAAGPVRRSVELLRTAGGVFHRRAMDVGRGRLLPLYPAPDAMMVT